MQYLDSSFKSLGTGTFSVPLHLWNVEQLPQMHQCWHASHPNWDPTLKSQVLVALVGLQISAQHSLPALGRITVQKFELRYCTLRCTFCFISNFQWLVTYKGFRKDCCCDFDVSIWVDNQLPQNPDYNPMLPLKSAVSHISIRSSAYKSKIKLSLTIHFHGHTRENEQRQWVLVPLQMSRHHPWGLTAEWVHGGTEQAFLPSYWVPPTLQPKALAEHTWLLTAPLLETSAKTLQLILLSSSKLFSTRDVHYPTESDIRRHHPSNLKH